MCLTTEALLTFLALLPQERIEVSSERIVIHAEVRDAVWEARGEDWCTKAPKIDAALRLKAGEKA
ncbi:hypothetical protein [Pseudoruegeria sp. HB172150]|uniref:hypothetical protein n=1 Tax=Pseudoruegeria sp. HB172150 TaxID=2721164 RepID=UPI0015569D1C|nr:hypothetical protein [Pseudoruegeria sp. HB172150]